MLLFAKHQNLVRVLLGGQRTISSFSFSTQKLYQNLTATTRGA